MRCEILLLLTTSQQLQNLNRPVRRHPAKQKPQPPVKVLTSNMKALFGSFIVDGRNKVNGHVVSKNRYGSYIRTKVTPVNPQTDAQQAARNRLSTNSQAWRGLTEDQRQGWIDAAINFPFTDIFGNTKTLSGQALYVKLNSNLNIVGQPSIADAPSPVAIPALETIGLTAAAGVAAVSLAFTPTPVPANMVLVVQMTGNVTPGKSFVKNLFRQVDAIAPGAASPVDELVQFQAVHGNPVEAQKIFARCFYISQITGQAGIPLQTVAIVAP